MSKYPKSWPVGGHPEAEAKVRQLQKIGSKWLRASGPGWVAEKQNKLSNVKHEEGGGFILIQFESLDKYRILPPWAYSHIVCVGPEFDDVVDRGVYTVKFNFNLNTTTLEFGAVSDELNRDVVQRDAFYVRRFNENNEPYYTYFAPAAVTPTVPAYYVKEDTESGGFAGISSVTDAYIARVYLEPVLVANEFKPTRHTVFLDPRSFTLSKYDTTYIGPSYLNLRRDFAAADKNKKVYFAEYQRFSVNKTEACYLIPKETYPTGQIDFNAYDGRDGAGWLLPLTPWSTYFDKFGFVTTRANTRAGENAKIIRGGGVKGGSVTITSQFEHVDEYWGGTSLDYYTSGFDVFDRRIAAAEIGGAVCIYNRVGEKKFQFLMPGTDDEYELAIGVPKGLAVWKNKVAAYLYHSFDANNTNYEWVIGGWDVKEAAAEWEPGDAAQQLPFDFSFVAQTRSSPFSVIGMTLRENKIFLFVIENWVDGDVLGGTANVNRPVVFVYKWGGELIKKIDLFTKLELENVGYVDAFLPEATHSFYASPF